jgi:hypothetical protein
MNTSVFELELMIENPDVTNGLTQYGAILQNKTTLSLRGMDNLFQIQSMIEESPRLRNSYILHISFTNSILSGTIDMSTRTVSVIFHNNENIENIIHQLIDIQISHFELNIKIIYTSTRNRNLSS